MDIVLQNILNSSWFAASAAAAFIYTTSVLIGKHLSNDANAALSMWLKGDYESTWSTQFGEAFDTIFGKNHFHWRCFLRSSLASIVTVVVLFLLFHSTSGLYGERQADSDISIGSLFLFGMMVNIVPDYLSLWETRWLLRYISRVETNIGKFLLLVIDAMFSAGIIIVSIWVVRWWMELPPLRPIEMLAGFSVFAIFFYSTFLTSVWSWLYCLTTWIMRLFARTPLKIILNIEARPMSQIGLVCGALIFIGVMAIAPLFAKIEISEDRHVTQLDHLLCDWVDEKICGHIVRLTPKEEYTFELLMKACKFKEPTDHCMQAATERLEIKPVEAAELLGKICDSGNMEGCIGLGYLLTTSQDVDQNIEKAAELYKRACENESMLGCNNLGSLYKDGEVVGQNIEKAAELYKRACDGEIALGCYNLGNLYHSGELVDQNYEKTAKLYKQACDGEYMRGCKDLGYFYEMGKGVDQNYDKALAIYRQACLSYTVQGIGACSDLRDLHLKILKLNTGEHFSHLAYEKSCDEGDMTSCFYFADFRQTGYGLYETDLEEAIVLYKKSCDGGEMLGCNALGNFYYEGIGVNQSFEKANALYQQACVGDVQISCQYLQESERELE